MQNRAMISGEEGGEVEIRPIETRPFSHNGISYNSKTSKIEFSNEAKVELEILIRDMQSNFPNQIDQITEKVGKSVIDAMVVAGEWKKATNKFLEQIALLLRKKKNKEVKIDKEVGKQIRKYWNITFSHITFEYNEEDQRAILNNTPIIVRPWEDMKTILKSLEQRLNFSKLVK